MPESRFSQCRGGIAAGEEDGHNIFLRPGRKLRATSLRGGGIRGILAPAGRSYAKVSGISGLGQGLGIAGLRILRPRLH